MKSKLNKQKSKTIFVFLIQSFVCIVLLLINFCACAQNETLTVISNEKGAPAALKMSELKSILMGEKQRWRNGNKITIALLKTNTPAGADICKKIYDMSSDDLKKYWLALVFEGKADAPAFFNTASEIENFVSENPGAIGIIDHPQTAADTHIVLIDGKKTL